LKKAVLFVFTLVLSLSFMVGSASAATELNAKIDKVLGVRYLRLKDLIAPDLLGISSLSSILICPTAPEVKAAKAKK
jgi:hypothetical protein